MTAPQTSLRPGGATPAGGARKPPTHDPRCGENRGFEAHRKRGEDACDPCRDAHNAYQRGWNTARRAKQPSRFGLRRRALERLAELHPADFWRLLSEEADQ